MKPNSFAIRQVSGRNFVIGRHGSQWNRDHEALAVNELNVSLSLKHGHGERAASCLLAISTGNQHSGTGQTAPSENPWAATSKPLWTPSN